jgi:molecular chaperone GrpE
VSIEDPTGGAFDPERHQALSHEHVPGFDEGTVVAVFRKGYALRDRLLRPALVKVAKAAEDGSGASSGEKVH